jgi:hypothetical protein
VIMRVCGCVCVGGVGGRGSQAVLSQAEALNVANLFTDLIRRIEAPR